MQGMTKCSVIALPHNEACRVYCKETLWENARLPMQIKLKETLVAHVFPGGIVKSSNVTSFSRMCDIKNYRSRNMKSAALKESAEYFQDVASQQ